MKHPDALLALTASLIVMSGPLRAQEIKGQVERIDPAAARITLKHEAIPKLDMEEMTTGYGVLDPSLLKDLKPGDLVEFDADRVKGHYVVTMIRKAR